MKKGDKVYVNWPTGRGGPYEVERFNCNTRAYIADIDVTVPIEWCEPVKPELEEGRLYYYWYNETNNPKSIASLGEYISAQCLNIEPVHRRWEEWSKEERYRFNYVLEAYCRGDVDSSDVMKAAYKPITGEEHP